MAEILVRHAKDTEVKDALTSKLPNEDMILFNKLVIKMPSKFNNKS